MTERRSKYNARKVTQDGINFDSLAEAARYRELVLLQSAGEIWGLKCHPRFEIVPACNYDGKRERALNYEADFEYYEDNGSVPPTHVVEDVKGFETAVYRLKRRLFIWQYPDTKFVATKGKR